MTIMMKMDDVDDNSYGYDDDDDNNCANGSDDKYDDDLNDN